MSFEWRRFCFWILLTFRNAIGNLKALNFFDAFPPSSVSLTPFGSCRACSFFPGPNSSRRYRRLSVQLSWRDMKETRRFPKPFLRPPGISSRLQPFERPALGLGVAPESFVKFLFWINRWGIGGSGWKAPWVKRWKPSLGSADLHWTVPDSLNLY